jgi:DNA-binding transcriptional LysR family regulator
MSRRIDTRKSEAMRVISASKLKAFHLAGMTGSFKHAAHLLSVTPSAISARVRSLERDLGLRLFTRGVRKLTLTDAGLEYIREVEASFANLDIATRDLQARFSSAATQRLDARQTRPTTAV